MRLLAGQLVAHPEWSWSPGMMALREDGRPSIVLGYTGQTLDLATVYPNETELIGVDPRSVRPALFNWATAGALLGMLPSGWSSYDYADRRPAHKRVVVWSRHDNNGPVHQGSTLGEAVARALLATWAAKEAP